MRQQEVGELRKTGEANRKRVKLLEQELVSQRIITKVQLLLFFLCMLYVREPPPPSNS